MKYFILLSFALLASCKEKPPSAYKNEHAKTVIFDDVPADIKIPSQAWDLIEGKAVGEHHEEAKAEGGGGHGGGHGGGAAAPATPDIIFSEVVVLFSQKNDGVLKDSAYKIQLPRGGGEIDLADYVGEQPGTFFVGFEFPEFEDVAEKKVLFISHARKRRVDDQVLGGGCNTFFDISKAFNKEMLADGVKVNTTRDRHTTLLGGTFLVSAQKNGSIYTTQVTFTDSKHKQLLCEGI
jgi:hypothetical protein